MMNDTMELNAELFKKMTEKMTENDTIKDFLIVSQTSRALALKNLKYLNYILKSGWNT
jgi:hypothetical protein